MFTTTTKTIIAKALYKISGHLLRIKTYQRLWRWNSVTHETEAVWRWSACSFSTTMLKWSMKVDRDHWDHWALVHTQCDPTPCTTCGGCKCSWGDYDEDDYYEEEHA